MAIVREIKNYIVKLANGSEMVPRGLFESREYFRQYGGINFIHIEKDGLTIAKSTNFRWGSIITDGKNNTELDKNIVDAILTAFEIPSSYSREAGIKKVGSEKKGKEYAIA